MPRFELLCSDGRRYKLDKEILRFGRAPDNTIVTQDPAVSRYHLNFYVKDDNLIVEDAGSQNGFLFNGKSMKGAIAAVDGDKIYVGSKEYTVQAVGGASSRRPVAPKVASTSFGYAAQGDTLPEGNESNRPRLYLIVAVVLIGIAMFARNGEDTAGTREPASVDEISVPLDPKSMHVDSFRSKSLTEIQAEQLFREGLRDYENRHFSRAILKFSAALQRNQRHEEAVEYLNLSESRLKAQLEDLMEDSDRAISNLQFRRARAALLQVLTLLTEQVPGYAAKLSQDLSTATINSGKSQEDNLLSLPCERTKHEALCRKAIAALQTSRQRMGEEDTLR
jgi:hypothetical protein